MQNSAVITLFFQLLIFLQKSTINTRTCLSILEMVVNLLLVLLICYLLLILIDKTPAKALSLEVSLTRDSLLLKAEILQSILLVNARPDTDTVYHQ